MDLYEANFGSNKCSNEMFLKKGWLIAVPYVGYEQWMVDTHSAHINDNNTQHIECEQNVRMCTLYRSRGEREKGISHGKMMC